LGEHVERLAEHAFRADLWARSVEYRKLACIRAVSRGANSLAIEHLERGLEALTHLGQDPEEARASIDLRLTALAALLPAGAIERAITLLQEAAHAAEQLADLGRLARVSSQLSAQLWCVARYDEAKQRAQQALEIVRTLPGDQFALESAALYNTVMVQHAQADFAAARAGLDELLARFADPGKQRRRLGWAGYPSVLIRTFVISIAAMTGSFADAARAFEEGLALAEELRHAFSRTMIMEQYGMCLLAQGEVERAADLLSRCLELCHQEEVHSMYPACAIHLGVALLEQNAVERARVLIEGIDDLALARAGHYATDYRLLARSELARRSAAFDRALVSAEDAVEETSRSGEPGFQVRALVQLGDVLADDVSRAERALAVYGQALELAERLAMRPCNALALQGMARVHAHRRERERARRLFERAGQLWTELECPARLSQLQAMRDGV
jgi:tetratricopeptide (TPR) repeat protein